MVDMEASLPRLQGGCRMGDSISLERCYPNNSVPPLWASMVYTVTSPAMLDPLFTPHPGFPPSPVFTPAVAISTFQQGSQFARVRVRVQYLYEYMYVGMYMRMCIYTYILYLLAVRTRKDSRLFGNNP